MIQMLMGFVIFGFFLQTGAFAAKKHDVPSRELEIEAKIYPQEGFPIECANLIMGAKCAVPSYGKFHATSDREGEVLHHTSTFSDAEGVQVVEEAWEENGRLKKARVTNKQMGTTSDMVVEGEQVTYRHTDSDGKQKSSEDTYEANLVLPSTLMTSLRPNFQALLDGKTIQVKMAVPDRRDSFTFNVHKAREEKTIAGDRLLVLEMSAASIIIKAFVSTIRFYLNADTQELIAFEGRSVLRQKVNGKWKELDVRNSYEYKSNIYRRSAKSENKARVSS